MNIEILRKLQTILPEAVIENHIIPYTYTPQNPKLLQDIRTQSSDSEMILQWYSCYGYDDDPICDYVACINTLFSYCTFNIVPSRITTNWYEPILRRHIMFSTKTSDELYEYITRILYTKQTTNIYRKIKFILGLLTPIERTNFINTYILRYDAE